VAKPASGVLGHLLPGDGRSVQTGGHYRCGVRSSRLAVGGFVLIAALGGISAGGAAGASKTPSQREPSWVAAFIAAQSQAKSVCAKAHASAVHEATFAGEAVAALRAARMNPAPWNRLPGGQIVFECFTTFATNSSGVYVDLHGHRTKSPPLDVAVACHEAATEACGSAESAPANP
jgi:hypothetical protein